VGTLTASVDAPRTGRWIIHVCEACGQATGRHKDCDNARRVATEVMPVAEHEAVLDRAIVSLGRMGRA
jgi:hypothetical protein